MHCALGNVASSLLTAKTCSIRGCGCRWKYPKAFLRHASVYLTTGSLGLPEEPEPTGYWAWDSNLFGFSPSTENREHLYEFFWTGHSRPMQHPLSQRTTHLHSYAGLHSWETPLSWNLCPHAFLAFSISTSFDTPMKRGVLRLITFLNWRWRVNKGMRKWEG